MKAGRRWVIAVLTGVGLLCLPVVLSAQTARAHSASKGAPERRNVAEPRPDLLTRQQRRAIEAAVAIAASLDTQPERDLGDIRIAGAVCGRDAQRVDGLLRQAWQDLSIAQEGQPPRAGLMNSDPLYARAELDLSIAAGKCDPNFAAWLNRQADQKAQAYIDLASRASQEIRDGDVQEAARTLRGAIPVGQFGQSDSAFQAQADVLFNGIIHLHPRAPNQADALYLLELEKVQSSPWLPDMVELADLGVYPFMAKGFPPNDLAAVSLNVVVPGETSPLPRLNVLRPGMNPQIADAYLEVAVFLLSNQSLGGDQANYAAALAKELEPLVERYAPEDEIAIELDVQELELKAPASQQKLSTPHTYSLDQIEKITDPNLRDGVLLNAVASFWRQGKFDRATAFTQHVTNGRLRQRLNRLIVFGRASVAIKRGDLTRANRLIGQLPKNRMRVLLQCSLAATYEKRHNRQAARNEVAVARGELAQMPVMERARLDVTVESLLARLDLAAARTFLPILTGDLNNLDAALNGDPSDNATAAQVARQKELLRERETESPIEWTEVLHSGPFSAMFPLQVRGVSSAGFAEIPLLLHLSTNDAFGWLAEISSSMRKLQILPGVVRASLQAPRNGKGTRMKQRSSKPAR